ncbi:MAG: DMT family transporter [Flavobacteriales bacterium]|nr:DMT family transporter [Flavobacteriales bacterium]
MCPLWWIHLGLPARMHHPRLSHWTVFILISLTWGSSFILMKLGMEHETHGKVFSAAQVAAFRLSMGGLVMLPLCYAALRTIKRSDWKWLAIVGFVGSGIPAFCFTTAETYLDSAATGILNSLTPLFTLLIGTFVFQKPARPRQVVGILLGLAGAVSLISLNGFGDGNNWAYSMLVVGATVCYGLSINTIGYRLRHLKALHITAVSLVMVGLPSMVYVLMGDGLTVLREHPAGTEAFGYIVILAIVGTAGAAFAYFWLAHSAGVLFASSVAYAMPIVAVAWGLRRHEALTVWHLLCGMVILCGVYLVNRASAARTASREK